MNPALGIEARRAGKNRKCGVGMGDFRLKKRERGAAPLFGVFRGKSPFLVVLLFSRGRLTWGVKYGNWVEN